MDQSFFFEYIQPNFSEHLQQAVDLAQEAAKHYNTS